MYYLFNLLRKLLLCMTLLHPCNKQWDCRAAIIMSCRVKKYTLNTIHVNFELPVYLFVILLLPLLNFVKTQPEMLSSWFCVNVLRCHHLVVRVSNTRV